MRYWDRFMSRWRTENIFNQIDKWLKRYRPAHKVRKSIKNIERKINHIRGEGQHNRRESWAINEQVKKETDILKKNGMKNSLN